MDENTTSDFKLMYVSSMFIWELYLGRVTVVVREGGDSTVGRTLKWTNGDACGDIGVIGFRLEVCRIERLLVDE